MIAGITFGGKGGVKGAGLIYSDNGGTIYTTARNQDNNGSKTATGNRASTVSADGGATFQAPFAVVPNLKGPVVQGSVVRLRAKPRATRKT